MTLTELVAQFRREAPDKSEPYLFTDADLAALFNEAEREACKAADLIHETDDEDLCEIEVTEGNPTYTLHAKMLRLTYVAWTADGDDEPTKLTIIDRVELERINPTWREDTEPRYVMVKDKQLRLAWTPATDGVLALEGYRLPLEDMVLPEDPEVPDAHTEPEIAEAHHDQLVHWALHKGYRVPDNEIFDKDRSSDEKAAFERYFGMSRDADRLRSPEAGPQFTKAWV